MGTIFISVTFLPSDGPTFLNLKCFASSEATCRHKTGINKYIYIKIINIHKLLCLNKIFDSSRDARVQRTRIFFKVQQSNETHRKRMHLNLKLYTAIGGWSSVTVEAAAAVLSLVLHGTVAFGTGLSPSFTHGGRNLWFPSDIQNVELYNILQVKNTISTLMDNGGNKIRFNCAKKTIITDK